MASNPSLLSPPLKSGFFARLTQAIGSVLNPEVNPNPIIGTAAEARAAGGQWTTFSSMAAYMLSKTKLEAGRLNAYRDYDSMDAEVPEVSTALDIISEFATQSDDEKAETFRIQCDDDSLRGWLEDKVKQLKLEEMVTPAAREVAKYGGTFWELVVPDAASGVTAVNSIPSRTMEREEDEHGQLQDPAFKQISENGIKTKAEWEAWQIVHIRYQKDLSRMYGNSCLESARRVFKQLQLMEDGIVIGRLYRSHVRFAFFVPVDGMSATDGDSYIDKIRKKFKKKQRFNSSTGKVESYDSPMTAEEDFWIGTRKDNSGDVKVLQGQGNIGELGDVEHLQNKLFTALKVPKALMAVERDVNAKATLTEQDINFARMLRRLQHVMSLGIKELLRRCAILEGMQDVIDSIEWSVVFPVISTRDDQGIWATNAQKAQFVNTMYGQLSLIDPQYVFERVMELPPDEVERLTKYVKDMQAKADAEAQANKDHQMNLATAKVQAAAQIAKAGAGGGDNGPNGPNGPKAPNGPLESNERNLDASVVDRLVGIETALRQLREGRL